MSSHRIIGHIFVDITVTSVRYMKVLEIDLNFDFIPIIESDSDFDKMWFIQDGSLSHWTNKVFDVVEEHFVDRILALGYP